jgi:hypothetical protein
MFLMVKNMVFDYVSKNNEELINKKQIMVFEPSFLYESIRNYLFLFIITEIFLIIPIIDDYIVEYSDFFAILFLSYPLFYFIINILRLPININIIRLFYHFILTIMAFLFLFFLLGTILYDESESLLLILIFSISIFLLYVWKGKRIFYLGTNEYQNRTRKESSIPFMPALSNDELISKFTNKRDWKTVGLTYYFTLLFILIPVWSVSLPYIRTIGDYPGDFVTSIITILDFYILIYLALGIFLAYFKTYFEKNNINTFKQLFIIRSILYSTLSLIVILFLVSLRNFVSNFYNYERINPLIGTYWFTLFLLIPLIGILLYYYRKERQKDQEKAYNELILSSLARNLTKYYLLTELSEIKDVLNSSNPLDFDISFKNVIENNLNLLKKSFRANNIKSTSNKVLKKYVLHIASPLRESLREAIGKNFTELYLNSDNAIPMEERMINYDEIWKKVNKAFLQWESEH